MHRRIVRAAAVTGLAGAAALGALCLTSGGATAKGCPPAFAPAGLKV